MLLWIDLETTGLDPRAGHILEVGLVVTDNDYNELHAQAWVFPYDIDLHSGPEKPVDPFVRDMHTKNGLWAECKALVGAAPFAEARRQGAAEILATMRRFTEAKSTAIAGSTIAFDRGWLREHMPSVEAHFSHRNFDVSVFNEWAQRKAPDTYAKRPKTGGHRALPDVRTSIAALKFWEQSGVLRAA